MPRSPLQRRAAAAALGLALAAGCAGSAGERTLYRELGGEAGVAAIVDGLLREIAEDERIVDHFAETDIARFRRLLEEKLCAVANGPCEYTGDSMAAVHRGMGVTEADFNALVEDLIDAMEAEGVPLAAQNDLLSRLAPMHGDIVADGDAPPPTEVRTPEGRDGAPPAAPEPRR